MRREPPLGVTGPRADRDSRWICARNGGPRSRDAASNPSVADAKGRVSVEGNVECPQPLVAPCSGQPCLYYVLKVEGSWKEGDSTKSKTYLEEKIAAPFSLNDGSGGLPIDASKGGDYDMQTSFNETKKEGFFADLKNAVGKKEPIMFGNFAFENQIGRAHV